MTKFPKFYFSTFAAGLENIIKEKLDKRPDRFSVVSVHSGLIVYRSDYSPVDIKGFGFFNNSFFLLDNFARSEDEDQIKYAIQHLRDKEVVYSRIRSYLSKNKGKTFKFVISLENQTAPLKRFLIKKFEAKIENATGLKQEGGKPDLEFWLFIRREGINLFGIRVANKSSTSDLPKGQLRPELANILCSLSSPSPNDIFLDPFSGSGALPLERLNMGPFKKIIALDTDGQLIAKLKKKLRPSLKVTVEKGDALNLVNIKDDSIDKIVTDPPWGIYKEISIPLEDFYNKMLGEFYRVTKPHSIIVVLIGDRPVFENTLGKFAGKLLLLESHNILVSGKKASVYKIENTGKDLI